MYRTLLSDYDMRQRELVLENAELRTVMQQMKKEMAISDDEDEEVFDSSKENLELYCIHAREKLTNSIRVQWRRLKSHVERLDSQGSLENNLVGFEDSLLFPNMFQ
ncbi:hypothetical protein XENOCAPTIV_018381 [Xenoophorus captivus]|uniref:Uncharacterized protein n=1 Tax=Xenoophorus captivus TaxID=1517983 RepID=A0ABV0S9Z9_9TELE